MTTEKYVVDDDKTLTIENMSVLGDLRPEELADRLDAMGDADNAKEIRSSLKPGAPKDLFGWGELKPWRYTTHQFGYIGLADAGGPVKMPIRYPGDIEPDFSLKNKRIDIRLSRLRIFEYPGKGMHQVLLTFKAQNQIPEASEPACFSQTYRIQSGQLAGVIGNPIFLGLNVGSAGTTLQAFSVNVSNDNDEAFLGFLKSDILKGGLNLLNTAQPAIAPFSELILGMATAFAGRNNNAKVQDVYMGLDFTKLAGGLRLAQGDYLAVQTPSETAINWNAWVFNRSIGAVVSANDDTVSLPYNYMMFSVVEHCEGV